MQDFNHSRYDQFSVPFFIPMKQDEVGSQEFGDFNHQSYWDLTKTHSNISLGNADVNHTVDLGLNMSVAGIVLGQIVDRIKLIQIRVYTAAKT